MVWLCVAILVPLTPIWLPVVCAIRCFKNRSRPSFEQMKEKRFRQAHKKTPRPLPLRRKYNLSNEDLLLATPNTTGPSPLLRLPYSVRQRIYSHLFANRYIIRVDSLPYRLGSTPIPYPSWWTLDQHTSTDGHFSLESFVSYAASGEAERRSLNLSTLRTCKQLYQEAAPLLYATNTFDFSNIPEVLYFSQTVRSHRIASVRYLQLTLEVFMQGGYYSPGSYYPYDLETWKRVWEIIKTNMTGLVELDVELQILSGEFEQEDEWLQPIGALRGLKKCSLYVYHSSMWPTDEEPEQCVEARKEVVRRSLLPRHEDSTKLAVQEAAVSSVKSPEEAGN